MKELFVNLENAIRAKKPKLAEALLPGLTGAEIVDILNRANVDKNVDAVIALYSWKNGVDAAKAREPFFPGTIYQFLPLEAALEHCATVEQAVAALIAMGSPIEMPRDPGRYLPVFWDGVTASLAIDLKPGMSNRVIEIEFESEEPFRKVCDSFDAFLAEAARAIEEDEVPAFLNMNFSS